MAQKTPSQLKSEAGILFPDNSTQEISPQDLREHMIDVADSFQAVLGSATDASLLAQIPLDNFNGVHANTTGAARTGAISFDPAGIKRGVKALIRHNDASAPAITVAGGGTVVYVDGSLPYAPGQDNYLSVEVLSVSPVVILVGKQTGLGAAGGGAVDSVNGQTGVVVLDPDDLDDTATAHKFATAAELSKLAGIEAGATGDMTGAEIQSALNAELGGTSWALLLETISQAEAEAGTATIARLWTAQRVAEAIAAQSGAGVSELATSSSLTLTFAARHTRHGEPTGQGAGPLSGNITLNPGAANFPAAVTVILNQATAPTITASAGTFVSMQNLVADFVPGKDMYYRFERLPGNIIIGSILNIPDDIPVPIFAYVLNGEPNSIYVQYSAPVTFGTPAMSVGGDNAPYTVTGVNGSGTDTLRVNISDTITAGETLTVSYDASTGDQQSIGGSPVASYSAYPVTNQTAASVVVAFDDFNDGTLNTGIWEVIGSNVSTVEASGFLRRSSVAGTTLPVTADRVQTIATVSGDGAFQADYTFTGSGTVRSGIFLLVDASNYAIIRAAGNNTYQIEIIAGGVSVYSVATGVTDPSDFSIPMRISLAGDTITFYRWDGAAWVSMGSFQLAPADAVTFAGPKKGGLGNASDTTFTSQADIDDAYLTSDPDYTTVTPV